MKRLLFLINYIPVCMFLMTCDAAPGNTVTNPDNNISPERTIIVINPNTDSMIKDSLTVYQAPGFKDDSIMMKRVEHGSNEQEKLDSIKNAKAKRKRTGKPSN